MWKGAIAVVEHPPAPDIMPARFLEEVRELMNLPPS
jgi:hypothetical protein